MGSLLVPRRLLKHFYAIYAYCRWADDLADEISDGETSLAFLAWWRDELRSCYDGRPRHPVLIALRETIARFRIPPDPFLRLLHAFEQDQRVKEYDSFDQLLGYCRHSANPVGHLVLYLFECFTADRAKLADSICTGLQLAGCWQDVAQDRTLGRVYLPRQDRERFGYPEFDLQARKFTSAFADLMRFEVSRARGYLNHGAHLLPMLPPEARRNVELFLRSGQAVLDAIARCGFDVWTRRPEVPRWQRAEILLRVLMGL